MALRETELESAFAGELELEDELEGEGEEFLGTIGNIARGLLGEGEGEGEDEYEYEDEDEYEDEAREFHGSSGGFARSLLGEGEDEYEYEYEDEQEEFIGGIGRFVKRNAGLFRKIAQVAAPMVGTALGGPLGGALASRLVRESEFEFEDEWEGEFEDEAESEYEQEAEEEASRPLTESEALAEMMAAVAAQAESEAEAEAMIGAATLAVLSARDRAALRQVLPHMVRATCVLARLLRRRQATRPALRTVPTIVRRTCRVLAARAAAGRPVTQRSAARVMARQTQRVLGSPRRTSTALTRNVRATRAVRRTAAPAAGTYGRARPASRRLNGRVRSAYR